MGLYSQIENDMKAALKGGEKTRLSVLRMLISAIKMFEIEKNIKVPDDGDVLQIIQKQIKQRRESIDQFRKGNRQDLADKESQELHILEAYMPEQLTEEKVKEIVAATIKETGAMTKADMGKVIKAVMEKVKGKADGKLVSQTVSALLK